MFEAMMGIIQDDFVRYVFHLKVVRDEPKQQTRGLSYTAAEDPVQGFAGIQAPVMGGDGQMEPQSVGRGPVAEGESVRNDPVRVDKTPGRNEPCFCGSGKKFKLCHGR